MDAVVRVNYKYPIIQIMNTDTSDMNEYLHEYFQRNHLSVEEQKQLIDNLIAEMFNEIRQKNKEQMKDDFTNDECETLSGIPIFNPDDKAEVAIKNSIMIGQLFNKGWNEVYRIIGLDNLGVKSLKGGKQKQKAKQTLLQYSDFVEVTGKRYAIQCTDIMEIPVLLEEKEDGRGKRGFYKDRLILIMINYLLHVIEQSKEHICTNVNELSQVTGLVNSHFKDQTFEENLKHANKNFSSFMINQLYFYCKPELEDIIFRTLDSLQNDFSIITYYKNHAIKTENGIYTSTKEEDIIIRKVQRMVLKEFGVNRILTIFRRKKQKEFYARVCEVINEKYGYEWIGYRQQIQIFVDEEELQEMANQFDNANIQIQKSKMEVSQRFIQRIENKIQADYTSTNERANKVLKDWEEQINEEILFSGVAGEECNKKIAEVKAANPKPAPFSYHSNYVDIQNQLITIFLASQTED